MPYVTRLDCPECDKPLIRKPGGRCPHCGTAISDHVAQARHRERRIEQAVAIFATAAVLALFLWGGGVGLIEGVAIYAVAGLGVWYWGKGTFWSDTLKRDVSKPGDDDLPE